jgi:hypothetical protein
MVKELYDSNLLSTFKKHSQFKIYGICNFCNLKYFWKKLKSPLPHVHDIQNKVKVYNTRQKT